MVEWLDVLEREDFLTFCNGLVDNKYLDGLWEAGSFENYRAVLSKAIEKVGGGNGDVEIAARHQFLLLLGESFEREGDILYSSDKKEAAREPYTKALQHYDQCDKMEINPGFIVLRKMCVTEKVGTPEEIRKLQEAVSQTLGCDVIFMSRPNAQKLNNIIVNGGVLDDDGLVSPGQAEDVGDGITYYKGAIYTHQRPDRKSTGGYIKDFLYRLFGQ